MSRSTSGPLPSWNEGTAKRAIIDFVRRVTTDDSRDFVPENERIAVFDNDGTPVLQRHAALDFFDDKAGRPVAINTYIGRRPILCVGNSDGDHEMLMWTTLGGPDGLPSLGVIVHHTDGDREFAYDRQRVPSGQLDECLDEAPRFGWVLADMKQDWNKVFPT